MNVKIGRFITFIKEENTRDFFAFAFYISYIGILIDLPLAFENICCIVQIIILILGCFIYLNEYVDKVFEKNKANIRKNIIKEIKKIAKEIKMFIPIELISLFITSFIMVGQSENQTSINETFYQAQIFKCMYLMIQTHFIIFGFI